MAKNPKDEQKNGASSVDGTGAEASAPETTPAAKKPTKAVKRAAAKAPASKAAAKKTTAKVGAKKSATGKSVKKSGGYEPSESEIRIRAYFIAEHRARLGFEGDPNNDWIEARQQLLNEAKERSA